MPSLDQARLYIERAEALGEPPEDPLLVFSVLYGLWAANYLAFNGDALCELAAQFLSLAEKQRATVPLMIGHRLMGAASLFTGNYSRARAHYDQAIALYDPAEHRSLATQFGQDVRVAILSYRSIALWGLGFPESARTDIEDALKDAREIGHPVTLMYAIPQPVYVHLWSGNYAAANTQVEELVALADEKGALFWKAAGKMLRGYVFALTGNASNAVQFLPSGITALRSTGSTLWMPMYSSQLARVYAELGQHDEALRCISEAMTSVERCRRRRMSILRQEIRPIRCAIGPGANAIAKDTVNKHDHGVRSLVFARDSGWAQET